MTRVVIIQTENGYAVRAFDFDESVYAHFTGKRALQMAVLYAQTQGYDILNFRTTPGKIHHQLESEKQGL